MALHPVPPWRRAAVAFTGLAAAALAGACGQQSQTQNEPTRTASPSPPATTTVPGAPATPHRPAAGSPTPGQPGLDPRFPTCKEANAHGYHDYVKGRDPEYFWYIDRDHDGVDCEPAHGAAPSVPPASPGLDPRFSTCKEANAHGYGPYRRGIDPEYNWYIDRDHDGIDCEPGFTEEPPSPTEQPSTPTEQPTTPTEQPTTPTEEPSTPTEEPSTPTEEPSSPETSEPTPSEEPSAPGSDNEETPPSSSDQPPGGEPFAGPTGPHLTTKTT
ncbi:excalibur calcium-binding domain-containing protein [Actinomadura opuntiae]|uniref:excalibur calcium-binding domain-containing protein n=1 Tax=Actinomadura sp. OS1-43 TaxID=604315 RepID=UPI00255ADA8B|nr:excalibur calcium-binding domain-containing protein [Actinomadura sp. OS1-43]MDL4820770.1 excalibur calcium-binding domain-containing protein [Actinomadura sp. OS1-43]